MIVDLEGVTIINDPDGMWHYENDKLDYNIVKARIDIMWRM